MKTYESRGSVVIAEDDVATRMMLTQLFQKNHFFVTAVENGRQACDFAIKDPPDIIIVDWHMPIMDGCQAIRELKSNEQTRDIPIIMLTSESNIDQKEAVLKFGAQDYINKPFDPRDLMARIKGQLQWKKILHEHAEEAFTSEQNILLAHSERRYSALAEAISPMIITTDAFGSASFCNRSWIDYTGLSIDNVKANGWITALHPDDALQTTVAWTTAMGHAASFERDLRVFRHFDGVYRWHCLRVCAVYDDEQKLSEWIISFTDMHDYRVSEETRRMLDSMQHMIMVHDERGFVEYSNPRWTDYSGLPTEESLGRQWLAEVHPDDEEIAERAMEQCPIKLHDAAVYEIRLKSASGQYRWFLVRTSKLDNASQVVDHWITTFTDIEEQKRAQEQLAVLYANEKNIALALKRAFVPTSLPKIAGLHINVAYHPMSKDPHIGGDWYDVLSLSDGKVFFCIGDVSGHGIEAAVVMVRARQSIISLSINEEDPSIVLNRANSTLLLQEATLVTAICGYINPVSRQIDIAVAGHPPPIIAYLKEKPKILNVEGICMGAFNDIQCKSHSLQARSGTTLILYTDGVVELNRNMVEGEERLLALISQARQQQVADLAAYLYDATFANTAASDDTTIMAISFTTVA